MTHDRGLRRVASVGRSARTVTAVEYENLEPEMGCTKAPRALLPTTEFNFESLSVEVDCEDKEKSRFEDETLLVVANRVILVDLTVHLPHFDNDEAYYAIPRLEKLT